MDNSCRSSFFPVELRKFENITSLKKIAFAQCFWQWLVLSRHLGDRRSDLRQRVNLSCCRFCAFCIRSIRQRICVPHKIASGRRDLLRVLVISFSHVPGHSSTFFTNNPEHVTTFCYLDSFHRLDLSLPKRGICKICSYTRGSDFALLLTLGRLKQFY